VNYLPLIDLDHGAVEYRWIEGDRAREPLVFLHEGLGCVAMWERFPAAIARASGRSALVYSRHGHGGSAPGQVPRSADYLHLEAFDVLPELLDRLQVCRPVLVGHSDGGSIALLYAGAQPTSGLVLMAPHVFVEPATVAGVATAVRAYREGDLARRLAAVHDRPDAMFNAWSEVWLSSEFRSWNIESCLPRVSCPVLLLWGTDDPYATDSQLKAIEHGLPTSPDRVDLIGCGHSPHLECAGEAQAAALTFLHALSAEGGDR
jgi:pimeloyl-ACP methyl ester carboxylesterase